MDKLSIGIASIFSLIIVIIFSTITGYCNYWDKRIFGKIDIISNSINWLIAILFIFTAFWSVK